MFFFKQFETFDPLGEDVLAHPFTYLPEIAGRARSILRGRSKEQVVAMAERINSEIEGYFRDERELKIYCLRTDLEPGSEEFNRFFDWDGGSAANGMWLFKDHMEEELEIPTANNTSEVDALKTIIEKRDCCMFLPEGAPEPEPEEYPEGKTVELFGVLALWLLADAVEWFKRGGESSLSIAGEFAVKAMDAVCYAEHLREIEWLVAYGKTKSDVELTEALRKQHSEYHRVTLQEKSERAKELNKRRHAITNHAKEVATAEWEKSPSRFPSAEKAGIHFAERLESQGIVKSIEPRTVTGWIRAHAKQKGIKLR